MRIGLAAAALCSIAFMRSFATTAYADESPNPDPFRSGTGLPAASGDSGAMFVAMAKVIFFLILIIGIFLVIMKVLAKKKWSWTSGRAVFHSLGGLTVGPNKSVQIVEIGRSLYVLGVGDDVKLIHKIDDPEEIAYITASLSPDSASGAFGWQKLRDLLGGPTKRETQTVEDETEVAATFQSVFQSKLKHMADRKKIMEDLLQDDRGADRDSRKLDP
ncbi:flagellar biosynthetic protein FliO [Paenibacillus sp. GYB003]|uniref:flagellar biosynthetic protein FliO n=1 Tax=Paenibacillus sp. GYB003 TaxID=2994392 RepID=UPI002F964D9D